MKKSIFVFTMLLAFGFISNFVAAQTVINSISVTNMTGCAITAQAAAFDLNCNTVCRSVVVTIQPHAAAYIGLPCIGSDALAGGYITNVNIGDPAAGTGVKVGNGCGLNLSGPYTDCQGITRTATLTSPTAVVVQ